MGFSEFDKPIIEENEETHNFEKKFEKNYFVLPSQRSSICETFATVGPIHEDSPALEILGKKNKVTNPQPS